MRGLKITLCVLVLVAALGPRAVLAAELSGYEPVDEAKRLHFTLSFSEAVEAQVVNNYAGNFVDIGVEGLVIPSELAGCDLPPADEAALLFHRFTRFSEVDGEGHVRLYLGKYADPSDVQVVQYGDRIEVDLVKPFYKVPEDIAAEVAGDEAAEPVVPEEDPGFIPDDETPAEETPAEEAEEPAELPAIAQPDEMIEFPAGLRTAGDDKPVVDEAEEPAEPEEQPDGIVVTDEAEAAEAEVTDTEIVQEEPAEAAAEPAASTGDVYDQTSLSDLGRDDSAATQPVVVDEEEDEEEEAPARPVRELHTTPSYRQFDLDDVPVTEVQLRNMPFNEALLELVAGSGFNVIVGAGVENELMTLDFRQKEISLKRALDLLCMAYDLAYVVEDDAIVIRAAE